MHHSELKCCGKEYMLRGRRDISWTSHQSVMEQWDHTRACTQGTSMQSLSAVSSCWRGPQEATAHKTSHVLQGTCTSCHLCGLLVSLPLCDVRDLQQPKWHVLFYFSLKVRSVLHMKPGHTQIKAASVLPVNSQSPPGKIAESQVQTVHAPLHSPMRARAAPRCQDQQSN